jgi:hypothetical protein
VTGAPVTCPTCGEVSGYDPLASEEHEDTCPCFTCWSTEEGE